MGGSDSGHLEMSLNYMLYAECLEFFSLKSLVPAPILNICPINSKSASHHAVRSSNRVMHFFDLLLDFFDLRFLLLDFHRLHIGSRLSICVSNSCCSAETKKYLCWEHFSFAARLFGCLSRWTTGTYRSTGGRTFVLTNAHLRDAN